MADNIISRRAAITSAAAAAVITAALPANSTVPSSTMSREYEDCLRAWIACEHAKETQYRPDVSESEAAFEISSAERWRTAKEALLARPLEGLADVVALLRTNAWQEGHFVRVQHWAENSDEIRTLHAVERLAGVSPWPVPEDLIALDAKQRAEEAARPRVERYDPDDSCIGGLTHGTFENQIA